MRYENLLASRYIKAQKRQSAFTVISIAAAVAVITMIFVLYSVSMNCLENTFYRSAPYHLLFSELTAEQGEAMADFGEVCSVKLSPAQDGTVTAAVLFGSDIGDRERWLQNAARQIGASQQYEKSKYNSLHGAYEWNDNLMMMDGVYDGAHLFRLRIFCIFFVFAILVAFALRLIIDTAFEVSSKERERHYGVLQSIGATPEQIVRIITYEGLRLCIVGVPFGLLAGIVLSYVMYNVLLASGLSELFQGMTNAKLSLPFSVDPKMLLVAAAVGIVWVFLSAYGVGMRIIKKMPMEAIMTRADKVEKVRKHTLSGLLFGISGSIASRNARRQKKRFVITVLTLTVSITLFALFSSLTETVEKSAVTFMNMEMDGADFYADLVDNPYAGITYEDGIREISESGLFRDIGFSVTESIRIPDNQHSYYVEYLNKEEFEHRFSKDSTISYEELVSTGGYILNSRSTEYGEFSEKVGVGETTVVSQHMTLSADKLHPDMSIMEYRMQADTEEVEHEITVLGTLKSENDNLITSGAVMIGAIETYRSVQNEWFGEMAVASSSFSYIQENNYNANDYKKIIDWINKHTDTVSISVDNYKIKWVLSNVMAAVRSGVLILNVLIALAALINLLNIISTGIANRRGELASLQCMGMTDRQLDRMAMIECLQFTGAAAIISVLICAIIIFGTRFSLTALINASMVDESAQTRKMLISMFQIDPVKPFVRILLSSAAAFAAGCVTSFVMLRTQNSDSLSDQMRGSEMMPDTKKSHILRNSVIAVAGALVLVIGGLRIYSVVSYHHDRKEYEKAGYLNLVESNGFKMNVYSTGAENGRHTIVGLAGFPCFAFPVETTKLNELLGKENTIVYPDRAGYGFSGDSLKKQTLRQVVEDYRTGLKNAGFEAPYVLMGHSYGGYYAMMWEAMYPDEVESIIFLSGTTIPRNECYFDVDITSEYPSMKEAGRECRRMILRTWLGLDRLFPSEDTGSVMPGAAFFSEEQKALTKCCNNRGVTPAVSSELLNMEDATREIMATVKPTETPKIYFSNIPTCVEDVIEYHHFMKADFEAEGRELSGSETMAKAEWKNMGWLYQKMYDDELGYFTDCVGNCEIVSIGGDHGIFYAQKPQQVADSILDFLAQTEE